MGKPIKWRTPYGTETVMVGDMATITEPVARAGDTATTVRPSPVEDVEDMVNHPNHYAPNGRDSFMHMKDQMGKAAFDGFLQGNAIKYVQRYAFKGKPDEDLCKAAFYLFHLAFEVTDGSDDAVNVMRSRLVTTLNHAFEHYITEE